MLTFQGKRVSRSWRTVLVHAHRDVHFTLDSGQRTMAEQTYLYAHRGQPGFAKLVAFPSPTAPHIRLGHQGHCLDVNSLDGGNLRLQKWLRKHDVVVKFNVAGEPWHMDPVHEAQLIALARKLGRPVTIKTQPHLLAVSREGVELVATFEGCRLAPYKDAVGVWTIGYGHTHLVKATTPPLRSQEAAKVLLNEDLQIFASGVRKVLKTNVSGEQFDALVSLAYNIGLGAFTSSTLLKRLNKRQFARAANQFLRWDKAGAKTLLGLSRRRRAERTLFLQGSDATTRRNAATGVL